MNIARFARFFIMFDGSILGFFESFKKWLEWSNEHHFKVDNL